jgi:uncharacterized protein YjbI with pentapeptide repeats
MSSPKTLTKKQVMDMVARGQSLAEMDMRGIDLSGVTFDGADLRFAKLAESNLSRASFRGADLMGASLWHSDCKDAVFDGANLEEADLDLANVDGATFRAANVRKAIFTFSRISLEQILQSVRTGRRVRMARGDD